MAGTSHLSIVDSQGNAVAMTTTIEGAFGSHLWAAGFLLNNELTDFSLVPREPTAWSPRMPSRAANVRAVQWRPDFRRSGRKTTGSPGGSHVIMSSKTRRGLIGTWTRGGGRRHELGSGSLYFEPNLQFSLKPLYSELWLTLSAEFMTSACIRYSDAAGVLKVGPIRAAKA
jgi:hypothetical protein